MIETIGIIATGARLRNGSAQVYREARPDTNERGASEDIDTVAADGTFYMGLATAKLSDSDIARLKAGKKFEPVNITLVHAPGF